MSDGAVERPTNLDDLDPRRCRGVVRFAALDPPIGHPAATAPRTISRGDRKRKADLVRYHLKQRPPQPLVYGPSVGFEHQATSPPRAALTAAQPPSRRLYPEGLQHLGRRSIGEHLSTVVHAVSPSRQRLQASSFGRSAGGPANGHPVVE